MPMGSSAHQWLPGRAGLSPGIEVWQPRWPSYACGCYREMTTEVVEEGTWLGGGADSGEVALCLSTWIVG